MDLYGPLIFFWAKRSGLNASDAADVAQESLLATARSVRDFQTRDGQGSLRGWLWTITRNKLQDFYRQRSAAPATGGTDALKLLRELPDQLPDEAADIAAREQSAELLHRALRQIRPDFEPQTWQAFWRVVFDYQSTFDVAAELNTTPNSVRQAKSRVLRRLREQLGDWPE